MSKVSTNISLDADLKKQSQALLADLGLDLTTAVTIFLKQMLREQGIPFKITKNVPNAETTAAMNEAREIAAHPEDYQTYASFDDLMEEVFNEP